MFNLKYSVIFISGGGFSLLYLCKQDFQHIFHTHTHTYAHRQLEQMEAILRNSLAINFCKKC